DPAVRAVPADTKSKPYSSALSTNPPPVETSTSMEAEIGGSRRLMVWPGLSVSVTLNSHAGRHSGVATQRPASTSGTGSVGATSSLSHAAASGTSSTAAIARRVGFRGLMVLLRITG